MIVNKVLSSTDEAKLRSQLTETFGYEVIGVIPLSEDLARLESRELIVIRNPDHPISHTLREITRRIVG